MAWDTLIVMAVIGCVGLAGPEADDDAPLRTVAAMILLASAPHLVYLQHGYLRGRRPLGNLPIEFGRLLGAAGFAAWLAVVLIGLAGGTPRVDVLTSAWLAITAGWLVGRLLAARRVRLHPERTLLVGSGSVADQIVALARRHPEHGMLVVGMVDDEPLTTTDSPEILGGIEDLPDLLREGRFDRVVVAFSGAVSDEMLAHVLRVCAPRGVRVDVVPRLFHLMGHDAHVEALGDMSLVQVGAPSTSTARRATKRALDVVGASLVLVLASPVMLAVALAVRFDSPGPVLFRQIRVGRGGRTFEVLKFRSMRVDADAGGVAAAAAAADRGEEVEIDVRSAVVDLKTADDRVTRVGRFIRRTSLDELPQLWNVLRGDMSLVGPRPLRPFEVATLDVWQDARHEVRPGVTGLWQVLGRSDIDWDRRMQMDYTYVRHWSLRQDLRVLARTVRAVLSGEGSR